MSLEHIKKVLDQKENIVTKNGEYITQTYNFDKKLPNYANGKLKEEVPAAQVDEANGKYAYGAYETDEDGVLQHYYKFDNLHCQFAKYRAEDGIYYFDVYAFNDYEAPLALPNSKLSLDVENMKLTGKYQENYSLSIGGYKLTGTYIMKEAYHIQLKKDSGKLIIEGPSKGIAFIITRNADALFVRYGTSKNNLKYAFNNGGTFEFDSQANYIEITAQSRVAEFETIDILN